MAEDRVVRLRLERQGLTEGRQEAGQLAQSISALAAEEKKLGAQLDKLNQKRREATQAARILAAQVKAGVQADSEAGRKIAEEIRQYDRLTQKLKEVRAASAAAAKEKKALGAAAATTTTQVRGMGGAMDTLAGKVKGAIGAYLGFQAVKGILQQAVAAISEAEATSALLGARVQSTGGMAERSAAQIEEAAGRLAAAIGRDDEMIAGAADELLKFDRVAGQVFDRVLVMALDMSAGTDDAAGAAQFLGKSLQDVEEGLPLLNRQWRLFSDAEEAAIVLMARSGKTAEAQNAVLDAMQRRVGGAAAAWRDTLPGAISAASVAWEDQLELLQSGLSPALRQIAEDFVEWTRSAEGQERIIQLGRDLGDVLARAADLTRTLSAELDDLDSSNIATIVSAVIDLVDWIGELKNSLPGLPKLLDPLLILHGPIDLLAASIRGVKDAADDAVAAARGLDPRAAAGLGAGVAATGGMTPAQRKAWDEAEAAAARQFERNRRAREDAAHRAAEEAKKLASARESALKLVETIEKEAEARKAGLAILHQEGKTREELAKAFREAEIAEKAEAKVQEVRAAWLKAGRILSEESAAAIREWVRQAERAADATAKWNAVTSKIPDTLAALTSKGVVIPARLSFEDFGRQGSTAPSIDVEAVIKWLTISGEADAANEAAREAYNEQQRQSLEDLAEGFRASLESPRDELERTQRAIDALAEESDEAGNKLLSAAEAEQLRANAAALYTMQQLDMQMSAWGGFFSYLGDAFGGLFSQIASALQGIQSGVSTGQGLGQAIGGTSSAAALGGAFGGTIAAFVELYKIADGIIKKHDSEKYGAGTGSVSIAGGRSGTSYMGNTQTDVGQASLEAARAIQDAIDAFEDALRISVEDLQKIEIRLRNNGKDVQAWFKDQWIGTFSSVGEAIQAALAAAIQDPSTNLRGLSDLMAQGLSSWTSPDARGLLDFLGQLRQISDLNLGPATTQLQATMLEINRLREALNRLDQTSQAVIDAQRELTDAQLRAIDQTINAALGIDTSAADRLRDLAGLIRGLGDAGEMAGDGIRSTIQTIQSQIEALKRRQNDYWQGGDDTGGGGGGGPQTGAGDGGPVVARTLSGTTAEVDSEIARLEAALKEWTDKLGEIPKALTQQEIDLGVWTAFENYLASVPKYAEMAAKFERMRADAALQQLKLELVKLGIWDQWAAVWQDAYNAAMAAASRPARGAGGGGGRSLKDEREDLRRELDRILAEAQGPLHLIFFDLGESIADLTKRWKEAKLPLADLTAGIAALTAAAQKQAKQRMDELAGIGTDFTRQLEEGLAAFDELEALGRGKTGIPDWLREVREGQFKERMKQDFSGRVDAFAGFSDPMLEIRMNSAKLRQELAALAEKGMLTAEEIAAAKDKIAEGEEFQRQSAITGIMDRVFGYLQGSKEHAAQIEEFELKKIDIEFKLIEAQLKALNAWDEATADLVADARDAAESMARGADSIETATDRMASYWQAQTDAANAWNNAVQAGLQAVQEWRQGIADLTRETEEWLTDEQLSPLTQAEQLAAAEARLEKLAARAEAGDVNALREFAKARQEFLQEGRESEAGGAGWDRIARRAMELSALVLEGAQDLEGGIHDPNSIMGKAFAEALAASQLANTTNADHISTAVYEGADRIVAALHAELAGLPGYAGGGVLQFPSIYRGGEVGPEAVVPLAGGAIPVQWTGAPGGGQSVSMAPVVSILGAIDERMRRVERSLEDIAGTSAESAVNTGKVASRRDWLAERMAARKR